MVCTLDSKIEKDNGRQNNKKMTPRRRYLTSSYSDCTLPPSEYIDTRDHDNRLPVTAIKEALGSGNQSQIKTVLKTDSNGVVWQIKSRSYLLQGTIGAMVRNEIVEPIARKVNGRAVPLSRNVRIIRNSVAGQ